jgi:hypothetical protein
MNMMFLKQWVSSFLKKYVQAISDLIKGKLKEAQ